MTSLPVKETIGLFDNLIKAQESAIRVACYPRDDKFDEAERNFKVARHTWYQEYRQIEELTPKKMAIATSNYLIAQREFVKAQVRYLIKNEFYGKDFDGTAKAP